MVGESVQSELWEEGFEPPRRPWDLDPETLDPQPSHQYQISGTLNPHTNIKRILGG
jgi:hypothetical protein